MAAEAAHSSGEFNMRIKRLKSNKAIDVAKIYVSLITVHIWISFDLPYWFPEVWSHPCLVCVFPGAEQASINVRTNIQVAQSQVEEARKLSEDADKKLAETKVEEIQRMAEYAASLENSEEHEVHEAYLRED